MNRGVRSLRSVSAVQNFAEQVIVALAKANVEFVVVGGISAVMHGSPIVTRDVDLCYRRVDANLVRLADALKPFQPRLRDLPEGLPNVFDVHSLRLGSNFTLVVDDQFLDLLGEMSAIGGYDAIVGRTTEMDVAGHPVKVLSLEDLIRTKRAAGRPKDLAVLPMLEATLQMQKEQGGP
jgi:predicted nucleotidyltransferase